METGAAPARATNLRQVAPPTHGTDVTNTDILLVVKRGTERVLRACVTLWDNVMELTDER